MRTRKAALSALLYLTEPRARLSVYVHAFRVQSDGLLNRLWSCTTVVFFKQCTIRSLQDKRSRKVTWHVIHRI
jgi:hypothetical protein